MLELVATRASVVGVFAAAEALDALHPAGAYRCRVAPDEAMFVASAPSAQALVRDAEAVTAGDADAFVLDMTDGWQVLSLVGDDAVEGFARLSHLRQAPGFTQGDVAGLPVRIVIDEARIHMFAPAMLGECLRSRIVARCPGLAQRAGSEDWTPGTLG